MSLLTICVFVLCLGASQAVGQAVQESHRGDGVAAWCWSVAVQYAICFALLLIFDRCTVADAVGSAGALTWIVRLFFFIKAL